MSSLKYLVLHCSATPEGREVTAADIRAWHLLPPPQGRGWHQVGYTDLIHLDGTIERLVENNGDDVVDTWEITNGAVGHNQHSVHICYVGGAMDANGTPKDTRTPAQVSAMTTYIRDFVKRHPNVKVVGHNQLADKACPSFDVYEYLTSIGLQNYGLDKHHIDCA